MTKREIQILEAEIIATSAYYQVKLDDRVIAMYAEDLSDLPLEQALEGYRRWRKSPKNSRFPLPAQIRSMFQDAASDEDKARDSASRIVAAISKFGYTNPHEARLFIGDLGWKVVDRQGGWTIICQRTRPEEIPTYQAQWTRYALSILHLIQDGHGDSAPALSYSEAPVLSHQARKVIDVASPKSIDDDPKGAA